MRSESPSGYRRFDEPRAVIVARDDIAEAVIAAYRAAPASNATLHGFASIAPGSRLFMGRETAYGLTLPGSRTAVVIRHNRHGGTLRHLTGDLFRGDTRAPMELMTSLRLHGVGVPTPPVAAYAIYPAGFGLARSDVVTEEIENSQDLGALLLQTRPGTDERKKLLGGTLVLVRQMSDAGIRHHDLNVKNILMQAVAPASLFASVLDVDRIEFDLEPTVALRENRRRLWRSIEKWRSVRGAEVSVTEIEEIEADIGIP